MNTLTGLVARGHRDVALLCEAMAPGEGDFFAAPLRRAGVSARTVKRLDEMDPAMRALAELVASRYRHRLSTLPPWIAESICRYAAEFITQRPQVVHSWLDEMNVKAGIAALIAGVPKIVLSCRSVAPTHFGLYQPYMRNGYRTLLRQPNVTILNNSVAGSRDYARWLGISADRIKVLRNGVRTEDFVRASAREARAFRDQIQIWNGPVIGGLMRFNEEKGPFLWIQAAAIVARERPDASFLMVGDGALLAAAKDRAQAYGFLERMVFPGVVANPAAALSAMDVLLLTSRLEGLPNALVEAQMIGVPVVTTDGGGASEAILPEVTGFAVRPHDARFLAERILFILADETWRRRATQESPAFIAERFGYERMIDETLAVYEMPSAVEDFSPSLIRAAA